jgi:hypothetical protein
MPELPQQEIEEIVPEQDRPPRPDDSALAEEQDIERKKKRAELLGLRQDINARRKFARRIFHLIIWWLVAIFLLLLMQGFLSPFKIFFLSDSVLLALIGGTTANVLGIFMVVVWYLFPKDKRQISN